MAVCALVCWIFVRACVYTNLYDQYLNKTKIFKKSHDFVVIFVGLVCKQFYLAFKVLFICLYTKYLTKLWAAVCMIIVVVFSDFDGNFFVRLFWKKVKNHSRILKKRCQLALNFAAEYTLNTIHSMCDAVMYINTSMKWWSGGFFVSFFHLCDHFFSVMNSFPLLWHRKKEKRTQRL